MDNSRNRGNDHLGVNKLGKNIRKSPLHQPNFQNNPNPNPNPNPNNPARQQPQPQVYNISKNDFRNIVQQLTGSPSHDPLPRPHQNPPKPQSMRLQRIRPPPLTPIHRPPLVSHAPAPAGAPQPHYNPNFARPSPGPGLFMHPPSPIPMQPFTPGDSNWTHPVESPISAYMKYLQTSMMDPSPRGILGQPGPPPGVGPNQPPGLLPSPTAQFLLPSPSGYFGLLSPRSPYPLLSPGMQFPPLTPNFAFSPMGQSGLLGAGPQPPMSPGLFPLSPSGFFPISSPRWRDP